MVGLRKSAIFICAFAEPIVPPPILSKSILFNIIEKLNYTNKIHVIFILIYLVLSKTLLY
jgi:hypothetical protein